MINRGNAKRDNGLKPENGDANKENGAKAENGGTTETSTAPKS